MARFLNYSLSDPTYLPQTSWAEHGPFAMWLVKAMQPKRIVELGTHSGFSYFSMCQAVSEAALATECFAVDTWKGDEHAGHYSEAVYTKVNAENQKYAHFSTLLRKTFDEALGDIADGTIDLLHVDGRHFYEDVKHDFETWVPKLSDRAVVLFHDTVVQERGFGVYKYWEEISRARPSFNFTHCHGLGVLLWGANVSKVVTNMAALSAANGGPGVVESFFETAGTAMLESAQLRETKEKNKVLQEEILVSKNQTQPVAGNHVQAVTMLQRDLDHLAAQLVEARRRPLKQFKRLIVGRVLRKLSKASPPLSQRTVNRFAASAQKRDPERVEIISQMPSQNYENIVEAWTKQRALMVDSILATAKNLGNKVMFSVIVPVYNPAPDLLEKMIASVTSQSYANWELCIADDASPDPRVREVLQAAADSDSRIRVVFREKNGHISHASNSAIAIARGDYIVLLDHDDVLDHDALFYVAECIGQNPDAKIIYTDEDKIREDGTRYEPHFKPDWNRELLYSCNYISHLGVYDTDIVRKIDGFRPGYEGAQDHDLVLRCLPYVTDAQIHHIPKVLYSWRASPGSTADTADAKPYAWDAGVRAVASALLQQSGKPIEVLRGPYPFTYMPQWPLHSEPSVTIIIPTRDRLDITRVTVETILQKTDYNNYEIVIVDNGSIEPETLAWLEDISRSDQVHILRDEGPFNYSALNNKAVAQSKSDMIALVNNDIEVISSGWLREMVSLATRPSIGCVGAKLYYPNNTIQHAGVVVGVGGVACHPFKGLFREDPGYFARAMLRQEYTAVTAACLVVRRDVFNQVGGLNEQHLTVAFNDVDFCLKVHSAGYRNLWTPLAELYHHESASRKTEDTPEKKARFESEVQYMIDTWQTDSFEDRAYNPNLTKEFEDFRLGPARW